MKDFHSLLHKKKMRIMIAEKMDMYQCEHPSSSKDRQKKLEWASALKQDQLQKEEKESQQPATADFERMIDERSTSQQAQTASQQQQPRQIIREYKIPH
uniref:Uncharacterized protein n=2 Tax=Romanomermis culicivorax TaxID=13658 RepID=A0A915J0F8_ROMCU